MIHLQLSIQGILDFLQDLGFDGAGGQGGGGYSPIGLSNRKNVTSRNTQQKVKVHVSDEAISDVVNKVDPLDADKVESWT